MSLGKIAVTGFAVEHIMEGCMVLLTPIEGHAALKRSLGRHGVIEGPDGRRLALNIRGGFLLKSRPRWSTLGCLSMAELGEVE